jgi:predicted metal-dependent peptidase
MNAPDRITKARVALLLDEPFFGSLLMQLRPVANPDISTMCTDGRTLEYSPKYLDQLNDRQLRTVLAHEVLHPALLHPFRLGDRDLRTANIAADYVINDFLDNYNKDAVARGQSAPFEWPVNENGESTVLLDHQYDGMAFEEVYAALWSKRPGQSGSDPAEGSGAPGTNPGGGDGQDDPDSSGAPSTKPADGENARSVPNIRDDGTSPGEFKAGSKDPSEAQAEEAKWKVAVKNAVSCAKSRGRIPGSVARLVTDLLTPKASWREILRDLITALANDDYTWARPNRRYIQSGFILPSLHNPRLGRIAIAIDTSSSIGHEELNQFMGEIRSILFDCRPEKILLIQCDAEITEFREMDPFDELAVELKGGGGTDFNPVFERLEQEVQSGSDPVALVYLTDLYGSFPTQPPAYPVIWACNNDHETAPFGTTIRI